MEIILTFLGSSALGALVTGVISLYENKKKTLSKYDEGIKLLLLSALKRDGKDLIESGTITHQDYEAFIATYNAYKSLGGDGWADLIKSQVDTLKVKILE